MFIPGLVTRTYVFTGCTVTKKEYGKLDAERSELLTENVTIAYREMVCLDIPFTDLASDAVVGTTRKVNQSSNSDNTSNSYTPEQEEPRVNKSSNSDNTPNVETPRQARPRINPGSNSDNLPNIYTKPRE
ncbi:hypothetical protein SDC9_78727 [bioreactor metagenome]|uniref:Uncharacterized protein n=1 Tax=bioreactor metagenome TaxID=1076179 RepID=A0A644YVY4_9ZZZZ